MQRHTQERGAALIMLIGITATLAILAVTLVMLLANEQNATATARQTKTSLYYAEAGLNSAVAAVKSTNTWLTTPYTDTSSMNANYGTLSGAPTVTYRVYDNATPVNYATNWDANGDGKVWVETTTNYQGRTTRVRVMVDESTKVSILPKAVLYADTDISCGGTSDIYGVNNDGTPDTSGPPYATSIMAGGDFTANSSTDLAAPADTTHTQSLGVQVNGSVSTPGHDFSPTIGGVGLLSDYFDQAHQAALGATAQSGSPTQANASGTSVAPTKFTPSNLTTSYLTSINATFNSSTKTYTFNSDLVVSGNLTLSTSAFPAGTIFKFQSLYVSGSLTQTGNVTVNTTELYTSGDFTISGATTAIIDHFGPTYVGGIAEWSGPVSVRTTDYTKVNADATPPDMTNNPPGPLWVTRLHCNWVSGGYYTHVFGPTWVNGGADTSNSTLFAGPTSGSTPCTVWCPLLATTEQTTSSGLVNFGSLASPMVYYMVCDNDGGYVNTCQWGSTGTYYGLMIIFEASIEITGNSSAAPNIVGSVMVGTPNATDITMSSSSDICYNQTVVNNCTSDSLKTTQANTVPGTWQQLSYP